MADKQFTYLEVIEAYDRIRPYLKPTPLEQSYYLGDIDQKIFFKLESLQRAKSFKIRGALNKMLSLSEEEKAKGVAAISSGNHGSSVAYAASILGIKKAVIIVPETAPKSKVDKIKYFGGTVMQMGANYDEAHALGMEYIKSQDMTFIDAFYNDHQIYGGQGTIALEILEQNPDIDTIIVPIGGGGLITGIAVGAKHIKPDIRIIGVQTEACPAMIKSYEDGVFYEEYPITGDTICDASVGGIGELSYELAKDYVDDIVEVSEASIRKAVAFMLTQEKWVCEGASAMTIAALYEHAKRIGGKNIALVISGGNIDGKLIKELLNEWE